MTHGGARGLTGILIGEDNQVGQGQSLEAFLVCVVSGVHFYYIRELQPFYFGHDLANSIRRNLGGVLTI